VNRKADFFLQNESIRIDSHNESNRIDSNRELECSRQDEMAHQRPAWTDRAWNNWRHEYLTRRRICANVTSQHMLPTRPGGLRGTHGPRRRRRATRRGEMAIRYLPGCDGSGKPETNADAVVTTELYILRSELSRRKLSPTLATAHYSCLTILLGCIDNKPTQRVC